MGLFFCKIQLCTYVTFICLINFSTAEKAGRLCGLLCQHFDIRLFQSAGQDLSIGGRSPLATKIGILIIEIGIGITSLHT
jgi:hypothetical protein